MKLIKRIITLMVILVLAISVYIVYDGYRYHKTTVEQLPIEDAVEALKAKENYTVKEDIPDVYFKALVAVEDRRFYKHKGFDAIGTTRAFVNDIKAKKLLEGGSTITQQLAKNLYYPIDSTLKRKVAEMFTAFEIEKNYSKGEILELYVNCIYYGSGYYSIYDASVGYFGKYPSELNSFEATLLVGIPNAPSVYSLDVNPELALERQVQVINAMIECEYIDEDSAKLILEIQDKYLEVSKTECLITFGFLHNIFITNI